MLPSFAPLSPCVYLRPSPTPAPDAPTILLFAWLDAPPRPLQKYTAVYTTRYPTSPVLLITTTSRDLTFRTLSAQHARLAPAVTALLSFSPAPIVAHIFSNGGGHGAMTLAAVYRARTGFALPLRGALLDSCPGAAAYLRAVRGFATTLRAHVWWRRWVAVAAVYVLFWVLGAVMILRGRKHPILRLREGLNDEALVGMARRTYVFGEGDEVVEARDVEEHATEAERKGMVVRRERFGGGHVAHVRADEERYWKVVSECWE